MHKLIEYVCDELKEYEKKAEKTIVTMSPIIRLIMADRLTFDSLYDV